MCCCLRYVGEPGDESVMLDEEQAEVVSGGRGAPEEDTQRLSVASSSTSSPRNSDHAPGVVLSTAEVAVAV